MHSYTAIAALLLTSSLKLAGSQTIDPSSVNLTTKENWCLNQKSSCPLLCLQTTNATEEVNECDATTLVYSCVCANGLSPNASEYSLTIPYFECTEFNEQCVKACANGDSTCQTRCRTNNPCGAQDPTRVTLSTTSTTAAAATSTSSGATKTDDSGIYTGFGSGSTSAPSSGSGGSSRADALAIGFGRTYGLALILAAVCGGFMIML